MDYIDPLSDPAAVSSLQQQQEDLLRQLKMAAMLRQNTGDMTMPQGQMVSGHYVGPHWTQQLAAVANPLMQKYDANIADQQARQKEAVLKQAIAKEQEKWMQQMPAGQPEVPPQQGVPAQQGNNRSAFVPEQPAIPGTPAQLPSALERMKWMARGTQIPGNSPLALAMGKMMEAETTREDNQVARREQSAQDARQRVEQKTLELAANLQRAREQGANQLVLKEMEMVGRKEIAAMMAAARGQGAQHLSLAQQEVHDRNIQRQIEHVERSVEPVAKLAMAAEEVQSLIDNATDPATGKVKSIPGFGYTSKLGVGIGVAESLGLIPKGSVVNNQAVQNVLVSVLRSNAGLSQTLTEQANSLKAMLAGGNYSQAQFIEGWSRFTRLLNEEIANKTKVASPEAIAEYERRGGRVKGVESKVSAPQVDPAKARLEELRKKAAEAQPAGSW